MPDRDSLEPGELARKSAVREGQAQPSLPAILGQYFDAPRRTDHFLDGHGLPVIEEARPDSDASCGTAHFSFTSKTLSLLSGQSRSIMSS